MPSYYLFLPLAFAKPRGARAIAGCPALLQDAGLKWDRFPGVAAHGTHSMAVEGLRQFRPHVGEANGVPVVSPDLLSSSPILLKAPAIEGRPALPTTWPPCMQPSHNSHPF
jgi:hypothetical protein